MNIHQLWKERQHKRQRDLENSDAQKRFDEQKNAVIEIVDSRGFTEIVNYFQAIEKSATKLAMNSNGPKAEEAKIEARVCGRFIKFLENLASD